MKLLDYINGKKRGKDAHRLEKESMQNTFLAKALEGFDSVEGDHVQNIENLFTTIDAKFKEKKQTRNRSLYQKLAAVCIFLVLSTAVFFIFDKKGSGALHANNQETGLIEIYVPNDFYQDNIALIAQTNSQQALKYRSLINVDKLGNNSKKPEFIATDSASEEIVIEIYVPE